MVSRIFMDCIAKFYLVNRLGIFFCVFVHIHVTLSLQLLSVLPG